jgi:biopolymer transport protein ExbD/biopolymer transport protein TolR
MNELNVTPMLDLCFCLLIIFMIATPVLEQTTAVNLPKAEKGAGTSIDTKVQYRIVSLSAKGDLAIGNQPVTLAQLESAFAGIAALPPAEQPVLRVRCDGAQAYQRVIDILSLAKSKGLTKVALDTELR